MSGKALFRYKEAPEVETLRAWHADLLQQPRRGERAQLRRAATIEQAAMAPPLHRLLRKLGEKPEAAEASPALTRRLGALTALAALASRVEADEHGSLGHRMAAPRQPGGASARVSEARLRRLLETDEADVEQRFTVLRRLVSQLDERLDLAELAGVLCDWTPARRRQLAFDYYDSAPEATQETPK